VAFLDLPFPLGIIMCSRWDPIVVLFFSLGRLGPCWVPHVSCPHGMATSVLVYPNPVALSAPFHPTPCVCCPVLCFFSWYIQRWALQVLLGFFFHPGEQF